MVEMQALLYRPPLVLTAVLGLQRKEWLGRKLEETSSKIGKPKNVIDMKLVLPSTAGKSEPCGDQLVLSQHFAP